MRTFRYRVPYLPKRLSSLAEVPDLDTPQAMEVFDVSVSTEQVVVDGVEETIMHQLARGFVLVGSYPATTRFNAHIGVDETVVVTLIFQRTERS